VRADSIAAAAVVATIAFWAYTQTLLPGVDLGDTGGFQAAVLWPAVSARQAYPLYYALAKPFVATLSPAHPALALNLLSAVLGACAVGILTLLVTRLSASRLAGIVAGLLLAVSYTFWTQAIIAEVYTLNLTLVGLCLLALGSYATRPTTTQLAGFCAIYALAFGNHLSMIILFIPFATMVLVAHPTPRALFRPRIVAMALLIAAAGALQYWPNFQQVWSGIDAPARWSDRVAAFWFDTTKADWRESMVLGVGASNVSDRFAMWWWDARQQFGVIGLGLAVAGGARAWSLSRHWAIGLWLAYACTTVFAFTYTVVVSLDFFLPPHYYTALFGGLAVTCVPSACNRGHDRAPATVRDESHRARLTAVLLQYAAVALVFAYIGWRAWDTWPAVDRHSDRRAEALVSHVTGGADESSAVIVSDMDWQSENALLYSSRWERRNVAWLRLAEVLPQFPFFVRDNHEINRDVVLTENAAHSVVAMYGDRFPLEPIDPPEDFLMSAAAAAIPRGAPYVLTLLRPTPETLFDAADYDAAVATLTSGRATPRTGRAYEVIAGVAGDRPSLQRTDNRPFRQRFDLVGDPFTVRMESWLPDDTFRRAGFGQVQLGHQRLLIIERGVSLVWLTSSGQPRVVYGSGLYAPRPRFRIPRTGLQLAALPEEH
jgi:hypothetical protein